MRTNDTGTGAERESSADEAQSAHAARVHAHLVAEIRAAGGWIGFERYMDLALYAPGLGYYSAGARKFGPGGDFTTAPEISPLFGGCVARQAAAILAALGGEGSILEVGAGTGRLAGDVLERLESLGRLPHRYLILETSADLRDRQRRYLEDRLPRLAGRLAWLDAPPAHAFDGVVLANEVLDALPVARFRWRADGVEELGVAVADGRLCQAGRRGDEAFAAACERLHAAGGDWQDGYTSEFCPRLGAWCAQVTASLRRGAALWFDYGLPRAQYYLPERHAGTLLCHYRQRANDDPLLRPGLQDITAWVDFTALAEAAVACGFRMAGFTTQAWFLAGNGIDLEMQHLAAGDERRLAQLAREARRLVLPGEMGESFKAMAWTRGLGDALAGFALRDLGASLLPARA